MNVICDHEKTHQETFLNSKESALIKSADKDNAKADADGDRVNDEWEDALPGMLKNVADSWKHFNPYSPVRAGQMNTQQDVDRAKSARDNEFYAWIGAAFSADFSVERVLVKWDPAANGGKGAWTETPLTVAAAAAMYKGVIPKKSRKEHDWSAGGYHWKRGEGR